MMIVAFPYLEWLPGAHDRDTPKARNKHVPTARVAESIPRYRRTLADSERVLGATHPNTLKARNNLAMAYQAAGRTAEAIPLLERTLADCERDRGTDHPDTVTVRNNLEVAYRAAGRLR